MISEIHSLFIMTCNENRNNMKAVIAEKKKWKKLSSEGKKRGAAKRK